MHGYAHFRTHPNVGISWNRGTLKSSTLMGFSIINHPFRLTPFMETPMCACCGTCYGTCYVSINVCRSFWPESGSAWASLKIGYWTNCVIVFCTSTLPSLGCQSTIFRPQISKYCVKKLKACVLYSIFWYFLYISWFPIISGHRWLNFRCFLSVISTNQLIFDARWMLR